jgi:hypothetical protein
MVEAFQSVLEYCRSPSREQRCTDIDDAGAEAKHIRDLFGIGTNGTIVAPERAHYAAALLQLRNSHDFRATAHSLLNLNVDNLMELQPFEGAPGNLVVRTALCGLSPCLDAVDKIIGKRDLPDFEDILREVTGVMGTPPTQTNTMFDFALNNLKTIDSPRRIFQINPIRLAASVANGQRADLTEAGENWIVRGEFGPRYTISRAVLAQKYHNVDNKWKLEYDKDTNESVNQIRKLVVQRLNRDGADIPMRYGDDDDQRFIVKYEHEHGQSESMTFVQGEQEWGAHRGLTSLMRNPKHVTRR